MSDKGFTLIELLVVIIIVGILGGVAFTTLNINEYINQGNDIKRMTDIDRLSRTIQEKATTQDIVLIATKSSPTSSDLIYTSSLQSMDATGSGYIPFNTSANLPLGPTLPIDPKNNTPHNNSVLGNNRYIYCSDGKDYKLGAILDSDKYKDEPKNDGGESDLWYEVGSNLSLCDF